jgi:hypothetical protein
VTTSGGRPPDWGGATTPGSADHHHHRQPSQEDRHHEFKPYRRQCGDDAPAALQRRRKASRRLPSIGTCGCIRDPQHNRHRCGGQITDRQLQGAVDAAHHLLDAGYPPIFDVPTLRELWKSGHHQLVDELRGGDL